MNRQEERRKDYGSPRTRMVQVETEGNLCGSVVTKGKEKDGINISSQEVVESTENDFSSKAWGDIGTN